MTQDSNGPLSRLWQGLRKKTAEAETALVRGKIAGKTVSDDAGNLIVDAGHPIDEAVIARAQATGKMPALLAAAMTAQTQDLKEKIGEQYNRTPEGQEARALESVDEYVEARRYIGRVLTMDVTDIRGNVIVPAGKKIEDLDVRAVRDARQLGAFLAAAQQSVPVEPESTPATAYTPSPAPPRASLLSEPFEESAPEEASSETPGQ